jgi:threonine dehydrogenase-like Zn-dependent dehydrogenase
LPERRALAARAGVRTLSPQELAQAGTWSADLTFELSGNPAALDSAIAHTGFDGRVIVGSWYGQKRAPVDLGGVFHRNRIRLISSQVSTLGPAHSGRWDKARRLDVAWSQLRTVDVAPLITHRIPLAQAATAYAQLADNPAQTMQILLTHAAPDA